MISRRIENSIAALAIAAMVLVGCSTGTSQEAEQGKRADENRESIISDMQATHTWEIINSTPASTPEETPAP